MCGVCFLMTGLLHKLKSRRYAQAPAAVGVCLNPNLMGGTYRQTRIGYCLFEGGVDQTTVGAPRPTDMPRRRYASNKIDRNLNTDLQRPVDLRAVGLGGRHP